MTLKLAAAAATGTKMTHDDSSLRNRRRRRCLVGLQLKLQRRPVAVVMARKLEPWPRLTLESRLAKRRLAQLAGTTCQCQFERTQFSKVYQNPERRY